MIVKQRGFTLLEMLVAIALFALLSLMGYQMLGSVVQNQQITHRHHQRMGEVQWLFTMLENDLAHARIRPLGFADFLVDENEHLSTLTLVKSNWRNPGGWYTRSELEKVRWEFSHTTGSLQRISLHQPESLSPETRLPRARLDNIENVNWRFWHKGHWFNHWPTPDKLPEGVEITLDTPDLGLLTRFFLIQEER
ncbi:type II secretion system minor pseudopilin GspJ [Enterobacter ludwigii]